MERRRSLRSQSSRRRNNCNLMDTGHYHLMEPDRFHYNLQVKMRVDT
jgi:hypothetical protein